MQKDVAIFSKRGNIITLNAFKILATLNDLAQAIKSDIDTVAELALHQRICYQPLKDVAMNICNCTYRNRLSG